MKKVIFILLLFLVGCPSNKPATFSIHLTDGLNRDLGHGFYTIDVLTKLPEEYRWSRDLYFQGEKIAETLDADISPSGRYALYGISINKEGVIVLFDANDHKIYRVIKAFGFIVREWDENEEFFKLRYEYIPNRSHNAKFFISRLKPLEE